MYKHFNRLEKLKKNTKISKKLKQSSPNREFTSNYFFKNKVTQYIYKCKCIKCAYKRRISTHRLLDFFEDSIRDYNYEDKDDDQQHIQRG